MRVTSCTRYAPVFPRLALETDFIRILNSDAFWIAQELDLRGTECRNTENS